MYDSTCLLKAACGSFSMCDRMWYSVYGLNYQTVRVCTYMCVCACVCVCVWEREREREREKREYAGEIESMRVTACVGVCVSDRERVFVCENVRMCDRG